MAAKDLTIARLNELRKNLKLISDDLDDLLKQKSSSYSDFSSRRKVELSTENQLESPSLFYSYHFFDRFVEVRRCGKSDRYGVLLHGFTVSDDFYKLAFFSSNSADISTNINEIFISGFDFVTARACFVQVLRYVFSVTELVQGLFNGLC